MSASASTRLQSATSDVEAHPVQAQRAGVNRLGDPGEGHEVVESIALQPPVRSALAPHPVRAATPSTRAAQATLIQGARKSPRLLRHPGEQRADATAHGVAQHPPAPVTPRIMCTPNSSAAEVASGCHPVRRGHQVSDIADREYFARCGIEDHVGIHLTVGAGDHHGAWVRPVLRLVSE